MGYHKIADVIGWDSLAKHPDHYLSTKIIRPGAHLSHIEKTPNIANDVNINISDYEIATKNFNTHPAKRSQIPINLVQSDNYPICLPNSLTFYTDGSKYESGCGAAFIFLPSSPQLIKYKQF